MLRRRHSLKKRDSRRLVEELSAAFGEIEANKVETAELEETKVIILDDDIEFVEDGNGLYPYLQGMYLDRLPDVVVDMGAVPYVCNGADVMAPGITEMDAFDEGDLVVIRDVTHGKAIAVGRASMGSSEIEASRKGKVIRNLHYVGDRLWKAA